jgi:hypothetical protein
VSQVKVVRYVSENDVVPVTEAMSHDDALAVLGRMSSRELRRHDLCYVDENGRISRLASWVLPRRRGK